METPSKLAGFALGLVAVLGAAAAVGAAVGPVGAAGTADSHTPSHSNTPDTHADGGHTSAASRTSMAAQKIPGGLMLTQDGYTLDLAHPVVVADAEAPTRFRILGPGGKPVTAYERSHGKDLHLIAVRRDMTRFQHVHPELDADGTWRVPLDLSEPGEYRVFADFTPTGHDEGLTLGADLSVAGSYDPQPLPAPSTTTRVGDYTVRLDGRLVPGEESRLTLSVSKHGRPVTDLQPYLQAYGHLVALRAGDLAYLHVHPAGSPGDGVTDPGPQITFFASVPSTGSYRLFLDFRHGGVVRTAELTAHAGYADEHRH